MTRRSHLSGGETGAAPWYGPNPRCTLTTMGKLVEISVQGRGRMNLGKLAEHDRYLGHTEPDGTIILEPAEMISVVEKRLLADSALMASIAESRAHPERLVTRDRSNAPRS